MKKDGVLFCQALNFPLLAALKSKLNQLPMAMEVQPHQSYGCDCYSCYKPSPAEEMQPWPGALHLFSHKKRRISPKSEKAESILVCTTGIKARWLMFVFPILPHRYWKCGKGLLCPEHPRPALHQLHRCCGTQHLLWAPAQVRLSKSSALLCWSSQTAMQLQPDGDLSCGYQGEDLCSPSCLFLFSFLKTFPAALPVWEPWLFPT